MEGTRTDPVHHVHDLGPTLVWCGRALRMYEPDDLERTPADLRPPLLHLGTRQMRCLSGRGACVTEA